MVPGLSTLIVLSYVARFYAFFPPDVIMILFFGLRHGILRLPEKHSCCDWREMGLSAGSAGVDKAS